MKSKHTASGNWSLIAFGAIVLTFIVSYWNVIETTVMGSRLNLGWLVFGSLEQFRNWFPNYPFIAFMLVKIATIICTIAFTLVLGLLSWKYLISFKTKFTFDPEYLIDPKPKPNLLEHLGSIAFGLVPITGLFVLVYFISKQIDQSFEASRYLQLMLARGYVLTLFGFVVKYSFNNWKVVKQAVEGFLKEPTLPYNLAALRIIFFSAMAVILWEYPHYHSAYFSANPVGLPYMNWYIDIVDLNAHQYHIISKVGAVVNLLIAIGFFTRFMLLINAVLIFVIIATPNFYGKLFHQHLWIWIPWVLTFSKCSDVWSVDSWLSRFKGNPVEVKESIDYNLPIRLTWLLFGIVYFFPGFQKLWLAGFDWALSDAMLNQIFVEWNQHYGWRSVLPVEHYPNLVKFGGLVIILFELSFIFMLFNRTTRWVAIIGGASFHCITGLTLRIWFPPVLLMYVFFIDWSKVFRSQIEDRSTDSRKSFSASNKFVIAVFVVLFGANSVCGFLAVYSYPFTSFPGYTTLYDDNLDMLKIEIKDRSENWSDVNTVLKLHSYRREDNTPYETEIINTYYRSGNYRALIENYWTLLEAGVPELESRNTFRVSIVNIQLNPIENGKVNSNTLIYQNSEEVISELQTMLNSNP